MAGVGRRTGVTLSDSISAYFRWSGVAPLAHELVHLEAGEGRACSAAREREVNRIAAARLVPFEALVETSRWARDPLELAEELWVTPSMLEARCETLTAAELFAVAGVGNE